MSLPPGVSFPVVLREEMNTRHMHAGDTVRMEMTNNLLGPQRAVVIPKGAKMVAKITEVAIQKRPGDESRLSFVVTSAEWKGGSLPLNAVLDKVVKIVAPGGPATFTTTITTVRVGDVPDSLPPGEVLAATIPPRETGAAGLQVRKPDERSPAVLVSQRTDLRLSPGCVFQVRQAAP